MTPLARILPLASVEEVRAELEETEWKLALSASLSPVAAERAAERRAILERWRARLSAQLAEMEAAS